MSLIAKDTGSLNIEKLEAGVYTGISSAIIDLGLQNNEKFNKVQRKFIMVWNVLNEEVEINGEKQPRTISKEYSFSLNEKSTLRKDLQAWRGKAFTEEELGGFYLETTLNKACLLQILLEEKNGKTYNNIASIMALQKGTEVPYLANDKYYYFDIENKDSWTNWNKIPTWIQNKIKKAENYQSSGLEGFLNIEGNIDDGNIGEDDDMPF